MQEGNTINKSTNFTGLNKDTAISTFHGYNSTSSDRLVRTIKMCFRGVSSSSVTVLTLWMVPPKIFFIWYRI